MYCVKLSEATFTDVKEIGENAFYGAGLTSFFIPSGCLIGPNAFAYCGSLRSIYTGDTMEAVSEWANGSPGENIFHGVGASCINCIDGTYFFTGSMKPAPYSLEEE
jgi:hypothetical protein